MKERYNRYFDQINPSEDLLKITQKQKLKAHTMFNKKLIISASVAFCVLIVLIFYNKSMSPSQSSIGRSTEPVSGVFDKNQQIKLNINADMAFCIIYNHRVYWENESLDVRFFESLKDTSLGSTNNNRSEKSTEKYLNNFASNIAGSSEVYSVKGYNSKYRLMINNGNELKLFECYSDLWVYKGSDLFSLMKIKNNIISAEYYTENMPKAKRVEDIVTVNNLINELYNAPCVSTERDLLDMDYKVLRLLLADGTKFKLRLIKGGSIIIDSFSGVFILDSDNFNTFYKSL